MLGADQNAKLLHGLRVLVVEDWLPLALEAKDRLEEAGASVVGPVGRLARALSLAQTADFDVAILDIDLDGERVFPVAFALQERGIPFILTSGFGRAGVPAPLENEPLLEKPLDYSDLARRIAAAVS